MSLCDTYNAGQTVNFQHGRGYCLALGRLPSDDTIVLYANPIIAPDAATFPMGRMFDGTRATSDSYDTTGRYQVNQTTEEKTDMTMSTSFRMDTFYNSLNPSILGARGVSRNTLVGMMDCMGWDDNGTFVEGISTTGTRLSNTTCTTITDAKWLFYKEGYFIIDGAKTDDTTGLPALRENPDVEVYNNTSKCSMLEITYSPTAGGINDVTTRYNFVKSSNVQLAEGDQNQINVDCNFVSEPINVYRKDTTTSSRFIDGFGSNEVDTVAIVGDTPIYKVNADYIISVAGGGTPTVAGTAGDIAVVINTTDDTVEIYKFASTWIDVPVTSILGQGFVAWTSEYHTALGGTGGVSGEVNFMTVKTAGITEVAVAGKYGTNYVIPVKIANNTVGRTTYWENYTV